MPERLRKALPRRMQTLPQPSEPVNPKTPLACIEQVEGGRLAALDEVERLEAMSDAELVAERLDLIEQTSTSQALCALILDIQKRRNIERSFDDRAKTIKAVMALARQWIEAEDGHGRQLWDVIRESNK